jgi:hypothetical protein
MTNALDLDAMLQRFRDRAHAVKNRPLPPIAGEERARFIEQAQFDFQDFAIIGDVPEVYKKDSRTWLVWGLISTVPLTLGMYSMVFKPYF